MKLLTKLLPFVVIFLTALAASAQAQTSQPPCTATQLAPGEVPAASLLLTTYQCLLAHYNPNDPSTDYQMMTWDLEQTGINQLMAGPFGISRPQRVQILNNYAQWLMKSDIFNTVPKAISVLKLVLSLAPGRGLAWLNLGDAYRDELSVDYIAQGNQIILQTPRDKATQAKQAVFAYWMYLVLSPTPLPRVKNYVAFVATADPPASALWSTPDAIANMVNDPTAAAAVLRADPDPGAKLALAMDMALVLPGPGAHKDEINQLMGAGLSASDSSYYDGFDGTAKSFIPYLDKIPAPDGLQNFPLPCQLVVKFPDLLQSTQDVTGGSADAFEPAVTCDDAKYQLPRSVKDLDKELTGPRGLGSLCGTIISAISQETQYETYLVQYNPKALLPPFTGLGSPELLEMQQFTITPSSLPLEAWGESDIDSYKKAKAIAAAFRASLVDLAAYYQSSFDLSADDANLAALHGAWLIQDAVSWANAGTIHPLAEALLNHEPLPQLEAMLAKQSSFPASMLFLAVDYPAALQLLLAHHPDLTVTTPIGKTALMEAAKYNQLESVKLLLAAGANVNAASLPPDQIDDNYDGGCPGLYAITHGSRTALMYAAANAGLPVINALIAAGANTAAVDSTGLTALDYLEGRGPVPKNSLLSAADFKIAAQDLTATAPHHAMLAGQAMQQ